jgi:hypothetical protein
MDLAGLWAYRGRYRRDGMGVLLAGGLCGIAIGAAAFRLLDDAWIRMALGAMSVAFVLHRQRVRADSPPSPASRARGFVWSTISGVTSMIAHAGGPPLSVYLLPQRLEKSLMVGMTVVFFAALNFMKLVPHAALDLFDARNLSPRSHWRRSRPSGSSPASRCRSACPSGISIARAMRSCWWWASSCCGTGRPGCKARGRACIARSIAATHSVAVNFRRILAPQQGEQP